MNRSKSSVKTEDLVTIEPFQLSSRGLTAGPNETPMTRVDFYIIKDGNPRNEEVIACQLSEKAFKQDYKILILGQSSAQIQSLNETLWTFKENSFIPHQIVNSIEDVDSELLNIALSTESTSFPKANLLINLSGHVPNNANQFERIAEIVPAQKNQRTASRARYKQYKAQSFELNTHEI